MSKKVLVVDDSRTARQQVINALQGPNYKVLEAVDGNDGLDKLLANADVNVVICDVNMPKMSGLEMLAEAKTKPEVAAIPFLMLTTEAQPELVQQAKDAGAKGWIIKPFKAEMLLAAVKKMVG